MSRSHYLLTAFCSTAIVAGCSGGGDSGQSTAPLTVQVVDAPIDPAQIEKVCISFTAVTLHYSGNDDVYLEYDPLPSQVSADTHCTDANGWDGMEPVPPVRLDALSGALTVALVDSLQVPIGRIQWIRLHFDEGSIVDGVGGEYPLACPSCEVTDNNQGRGFKLNRSFEVPAGGLALLIDIDLLKSLHQNADGYILRPTARIEINDSLGTIAGDVDGQIVTDLGGETFEGGDVDTGCAVYVFPDDVSDIDDFHYMGSNVISTATVRYNGEAEPSYSYAAGGLPGGEVGAPESYRVALTCGDDDPLTDDDVLIDDDPLPDEDGTVRFIDVQTANVVAGETAEVHFGL
jgi:hypothetical protein